MAIEGTFSMRTREEQAWQTYRGAVVTSHRNHALSATDAVLATILIEPETPEVRVLLSQFPAEDISDIPADALSPCIATLAAVYGTPDHNRLAAAVRQVIRLLTDDRSSHSTVDERIVRAIEVIKDRLNGPITQVSIAGEVFLSPNRLRDLFVEQTGMPFRTYILWLRLQRVLEYAMKGMSLTHAAHSAGFSDLAHKSRTFSVEPAAYSSAVHQHQIHSNGYRNESKKRVLERGPAPDTGVDRARHYGIRLCGRPVWPHQDRSRDHSKVLE